MAGSLNPIAAVVVSRRCPPPAAQRTGVKGRGLRPRCQQTSLNLNPVRVVTSAGPESGNLSRATSALRAGWPDGGKRREPAGCWVDRLVCCLNMLEFSCASGVPVFCGQSRVWAGPCVGGEKTANFRQFDEDFFSLKLGNICLILKGFSFVFASVGRERVTSTHLRS